METSIVIPDFVDARIGPRGSLENLSQAEIEKLLDSRAGGLYQLFRKCALAVLNSGSESHNAKEIFDRYRDFEVELVRQAGQLPAPAVPDVFVMAQGEGAQRVALRLAEQLRDASPGRAVVVHCGTAKFKTQFRRADESGARLALIVGDDELARGVIALKPLRGAETTQVEYPVAELSARVDEFFRRST